MTGPDPRLHPEEEPLVRICAALAAWNRGDGRREDVTWALRIAADTADGASIEEAILQSYLFLGYPAVLNAFALWREVTDGEAGRAVDVDPEAWEARGREICRRIYGGQYERLRSNVRALHGDVERWMVVEGYGKVLGRPGLELRVRELCVVAVLAVSGWPTQLYSHLRGALNAGASVEEVEAALEIGIALADDRATAKARTTWRRLMEGGAPERASDGDMLPEDEVR